ncbi:hypothetical protein I552_1296 [Mycobacterium xenopi 3993]|nr:hypothetical protein I552_1296 [Mycobacterium xenopi 3993]
MTIYAHASARARLQVPRRRRARLRGFLDIFVGTTKLHRFPRSPGRDEELTPIGQL